MKRALPGLIFAALVLATYADPLFTGRAFGGRDLVPYNLPVEKAVHDAYARGRLPVWMADISGGRPLAANPNVGAFYPARPLLALLPFPAAARFSPVLHWVLAGWGAMLLLRAAAPGASTEAAFVCAATYVFCGIGVSEAFYTNHHPGVALLPWIAWAAWRDAGTARRVVRLSLFLGLDLLAGDPFTAGLGALTALLALSVARAGAARLRGAAVAGSALLLALVLAAPQILAAVLWAPETRRAVSGLTLGEALTFCVHPLRLIELVVPFPFGETWAVDPSRVWGARIFGGSSAGFFATLYCGALGVIGAVSLWRSREAPARFARALLLAGLALSVPGSLLPASLADRASPVPLRYPEKFAVAIALALALYAGLGLDAAKSWRRIPRWTLGVAAALCALAVLAAAFPAAAGRSAVALAGEDTTYAAAAARELPAALAAGGLLWAVSLVALELSRGGRGRRLVAAGLLALVPIVACRRIARTFCEEAVFAPTAFARTVAKKDPELSYRVLGASILRPESSRVGFLDLRSDVAALEYPRRNWIDYTQTFWGRGTVFNGDFDRADLSRFDSLRRLVVETGRLPDPASFLASLSLRFGIRYRDEPVLPGFHRIGGDRVQDWDESAAALPDVRLASAWREARSAPEALGLLTGGLPADAVVLETSTTGGGQGGGAVRILEKSPERLVAETESRTGAWLFVLRGYWPYRDVLVDGRPAEAVPAQLAFSAVGVPAGRHRVEWQEKLPGLEVSRWGPVLFGLAVAFLLLRRGEGR
jgi:hypothetical protein